MKNQEKNKSSPTVKND